MNHIEFNWDELSNETKQVYISVMLENYELEEALRTLKNYSYNMNAFFKVVYALKDSIINNRGVIIPLDNSSIETGHYNLDLVSKDVKGEIQCVMADNSDEKFACVFTNRFDFFDEYPAMSGGVMFINQVLEYFFFNDDVDGIIINPNEDKIVLPKDIIAGFVTILGDLLKQ